jgi:hypothetical protein
MIIDKQAELSNEQAVTAAAASTNHYDQGAAGEPGIDGELQLAITCTETVTSGGASTVQFQLQCDDNDSFSSAKTVIQTAAIPKATLVAGYQIFLPIPVGLDERYIRLYYAVATADLTAGKFTAQIVQGIQKSKSYPDAI